MTWQAFWTIFEPKTESKTVLIFCLLVLLFKSARFCYIFYRRDARDAQNSCNFFINFGKKKIFWNECFKILIFCFYRILMHFFNCFFWCNLWAFKVRWRHFEVCQIRYPLYIFNTKFKQLFIFWPFLLSKQNSYFIL
jgi:hypothetical protein